MNRKLAEYLFPHIKTTPADLEVKFPKRTLSEGKKVTRLGPSPTGFIHLGNLYGAFVDERLAHQSGGIFYLRIEDTDNKRYVEGAAEKIIDALSFFDINFDEGALKGGEKGDYGPYRQSEREDIYKVYVKDLVARGVAYPCFLTEKEVGDIREKQEAEKLVPGIYGKYALHRSLSFEDIKNRIERGEEYVVRLASAGREGESGKKIEVRDAVRGSLEMPENFQDVVILKANGIPTYHFAHVVDDHLMRTTHVVRGEEWLSSLPIHIELFNVLGFKEPVYCHTAQLMKIDEEGNKRKLSKRLDPELALDFYREQGFHSNALREYLLTVLNSNYEEWRAENPYVSSDEFQFSLEKMSKSGTLFDLDKLKDVSKDALLRTDASELADFLLSWAKEFEPEFYEVAKNDREKLSLILDIGRKDKKPRKDLIYGKQIIGFIGYFYEKYFKIEDSLPKEISAEDGKNILEMYIQNYSLKDDNETWFGKIREISVKLGFAAKPKDYKKNPEDYKGHVGHVSTVIRLAVTGRSQSPDLWEIQRILGEEEIKKRIENFKNTL